MVCPRKNPMDDEFCSRLELHAALRLSDCPSSLTFNEWWRLLAPLPARMRRVVILYGMMGLDHNEVGERLGDVSRAISTKLWDKAKEMVRDALTRMMGIDGWVFTTTGVH